MNNSTPTQSRNAHFISTCLRVIERNSNIGLRAAVRMAIATKPECYFVTFEQARIALSKLNGTRTRQPISSDSPHYQRWREISLRTKQRMAANIDDDYNSALLYVITQMRPSRYFISEDRAMRLIRPYIINSRQISLKKS